MQHYFDSDEVTDLEPIHSIISTMVVLILTLFIINGVDFIIFRTIVVSYDSPLHEPCLHIFLITI